MLAAFPLCIAILCVSGRSSQPGHFLTPQSIFSLTNIHCFSPHQIRKIKRVGVWPVGLVGGLIVEKPIVNSQGIVTGFNALWSPERPFAIDMAGFAINLDLIKKNEAVSFSFEVERGYQETAILSSVVNSVHELEPYADNCTKVSVIYELIFKINFRHFRSM